MRYESDRILAMSCFGLPFGFSSLPAHARKPAVVNKAEGKYERELKAAQESEKDCANPGIAETPSFYAHPE